VADLCVVVTMEAIGPRLVVDVIDECGMYVTRVDAGAAWRSVSAVLAVRNRRPVRDVQRPRHAEKSLALSGKVSCHIVLDRRIVKLGWVTSSLLAQGAR